MMKNNKNAFIGLLIIIIAIYAIISNLGILPRLPIVKIGFTICLAAWAIKGVKERSYFCIFLPLAVIGCMYDELLHIEAITPWILIIAAGALAVGCEMIFGGSKIWISGNKDVEINPGEIIVGDTVIESTGMEDDKINIESTFGTHTQYVNNPSVKFLSAENNFGTLSVYLSNAGVSSDGASVRVENNFGQTTIYVPAYWNVNISEQAAFGNVRFVGQATPDISLPQVNMNIECNFGQVVVVFG